MLFLDELGEFPPALLDGLRQPVEDGWVTIARKGAAVRFPSDIQLIGATNPCPCGFEGDEVESCACTERAIERYRRRLSGPLLDRFDLRVWLGRPDTDSLLGPPGEPSRVVAERVSAARSRQRARGVINRRLARRDLDELAVAADATQLVTDALRRGVLTGRGYDRVRRMARTVADLDDRDQVGREHMAEALSLRGRS